MTKNRLLGTLLLAIAMASPVQAAVLNTVAVGDTIGGFRVTSLASGWDYLPTQQGQGFDAFGFNVIGPGGINDPLLSFGTAVSDNALNTFVTANVPDAGFTLLFNGLTNHAGVDLVLFEIGNPEAINLKIGTSAPITLTGTTLAGDVITGLPATGENHNINMIAIDLTTFGVGAGASVSSIVLGLPNGGADFALGAAVVPVPAAVWMFGSGLIGLVGIARRRRA